MKIFLVTLLIYGLAMLGLGVGRLLGRRPPRACGGCDDCRLDR